MSKIGHNNPPKDRKINWKTISLNKWSYKDLKKCGEYYRHLRNCFGLLEGAPPEKDPSITWVIEMLVQEKLSMITRIDTQDNGRIIWEQMEKRLLRTYNSKKGLQLNEK